MKKFIFPGSFDPFTNGHKAIVDQTYKLCDEFIIALATNLKKGEGLIKRSERVKLIKEIFKDYPNVTVIDMTDTLISDYCKKIMFHILLEVLEIQKILHMKSLWLQLIII